MGWESFDGQKTFFNVSVRIWSMPIGVYEPHYYPDSSRFSD